MRQQVVWGQGCEWSSRSRAGAAAGLPPDKVIGEIARRVEGVGLREEQQWWGEEAAGQSGAVWVHVLLRCTTALAASCTLLSADRVGGDGIYCLRTISYLNIP